MSRPESGRIQGGRKGLVQRLPFDVTFVLYAQLLFPVSAAGNKVVAAGNKVVAASHKVVAACASGGEATFARSKHKNCSSTRKSVK